MLAVDDMRRQALKGTTDWTEYSISLLLHEEARQLTFGVAVTGTGKIWADDLQLLVDGKPFWEAPQRQETVISRDHEFDGGSKIAISELTSDQIEALTVLAKVWGFLKYHHPRVTGGTVHHDYELFRIMPSILSAADSATARKELHTWVTSLGPVKSCTRCAALNTEKLHLRPQLEWLSDSTLLGAELSNTLGAIYRNRPEPPGQFYVSLATAGNPVFHHEPSNGSIKLPDTGYQLLALFRFWNMIEYWFPYRDIIGENWDAVLTEFIPRIVRPRTREAYQLVMTALIARVNDTHANLWSSLNVRPPAGSCQVPVKVRFLGKQAVVSAYADGQEGALKPGDVIESVDGVPVPDLVARWAPYYAASNEPTRLRDIAGAMLRGNCVETFLRVSRGEEKLDLKAPRVAQSSFNLPRWHEMPGETFRKLSNDVAYLKISSAKEDAAKSYVEAAVGTKGLVIDIRSYPSSFMVFALGSHLVDRTTPFARFTKADLTNPGAFHWAEPEVLQPAKPHYPGKVVILVDEVSLSSAEFTAMAFRASPRATVVGSTTAAADGNVSVIPLPGALRSMMSGIGVFYPDKRPTQRIGIVPDVVVRPTADGIRSGRDEVLEQALRLILGDGAPAAEIEKMARH
jgi:Peptidase family S41